MPVLKVGDTAHPLTGAVLQADGVTPVNLTGATATITVKNQVSGVIVNASPVTITNPTAGAWSYWFTLAQVAVWGNFQAELRITFMDGTIAHAPTVGFMPIIIAPALDSAV